MTIIRKGEAKRFENAYTCVAFEYETKGTDSNIARIEIKGRYPVQGAATNKEVKELVYVIGGEGIVSVDGRISGLSEGDVIAIEKGEAVFWEGSMELVIACAPAWSAEQYVVEQ